jgi:ABC-type molybdate transport system substrate-binding protein
MLSSKMRQLMLGGASAAILISSPFAAYAGDPKPQTKTNINLAVASNFYGTPPSNSAITDIINAFEMESSTFSVTVVDFGATGDLEDRIINGNTAGVDIFLAADTDHPLDLLKSH